MKTIKFISKLDLMRSKEIFHFFMFVIIFIALLILTTCSLNEIVSESEDKSSVQNIELDRLWFSDENDLLSNI
jgi:hypothetical protein